MERNGHVLIIGVGNLLLGDEGIGIHVVHKLQTLDLPPEIEVVDGGTAGFELLYHARGKSKIIVVDAMHAAALPGTMYRFTPGQIDWEHPSPFSAHANSLGTFFRFVQTIEPSPDVVVIGIVSASIEIMTMEMSEPLRAQFDSIVSKVLKEATGATIREPFLPS